MKKYLLKIFCDFDGTITQNDVWVSSLGKFIIDRKKFDILCKEFETGLITARQCILNELKLIENFSFYKFKNYINTEKLDPYFREFVNFCKENNYELTILSEGLNYYINYFLNKENLNLNYFCNNLSATYSLDRDKGNFSVSVSCDFPFTDENCSWCGMSKRNILVSYTNEYEDDISVYIGDGVSDFCVSNYADIVFAKGSLASYCWKNNITYYEYKNFSDILKKIDKLKLEKKLKHRQSAKQLRKELYAGG